MTHMDALLGDMLRGLYDGRQSTYDEVRALLRRDWAVRVLDAWTVAKVKAGRWFECFPKDKGQCSCDLIGAAGRESYWADDPDAARHAAALAVYPTLPADVRAELKKCP